jgi:diguanylate cyclase (GGDEF)-like protein
MSMQVRMQHSGAHAIDDEREVMSRTAGGLWLISAAVGLGGLLLPGASHEHVGVLLVLMIPVGLHGLCCALGLGWTRASIRAHGIGSVVMFPCIGIALWATGGADSHLSPLVLLATIFVGYFFPPRWSAILTAELILVAATPLALDHQAAIDHGYLPWWLSFAAAACAATVAVSALKLRLVGAERLQREMAHRDALTGLANRRAFDASLAHGIETGRPFTLLVIDLDDFKGINDSWGHPTGDRVLREIAAHCAAVVREDDCLARIGGDEFAVVATGARSEGAARMAAVLEEAVGRVTRGDGDAPVRATVTSAAFPDDGTTVAELMKVADGALHARKRAQRPVADV